MPMPWANKTELGKTAAVLASVLGISLGLRGVSFVAGISLYGSGVANERLRNANEALMVGGQLEVVAIIGSIVGLIVVGLIAFWRPFRGGNSDGQQGTEA